MAGLCLTSLLISAGCSLPPREVERFADAVNQLNVGASHDTARLFLGFPGRTSPDRRNWWYIRPEPEGLTIPGYGLSAVLRFDENEHLTQREAIWWLPVSGNTYRLRVEQIAADEQTPEPEESSFEAFLGLKLEELSTKEARYHLVRQEASWQLSIDGTLLLSMERWQKPGLRLTSIRGEIDTAAHPAVVDAIRLAWQVRRFAIELEM